VEPGSPETAARPAPRALTLLSPAADEPVRLVHIDRRRNKCGHRKLYNQDGDACGLVVDKVAGTARPCSKCIAWRRKVQQQEFRLELDGDQDVVQQSAFKKWHLPHNGKPEPDCGRATFFAHNHAGGAHYWLYNLPCKRRSCTKCGPTWVNGEIEKAGAWESRIARQWESELGFWRSSEEAHALAVHTNQRRVPLVHVVVSVPPKKWDELAPHEKTREALASVRSSAHRKALGAGMIGAFWVMHGLRVPGKWNDRTCAADGLHFHYIGATDRPHGLVDGDFVKRCHKRTGWIVKRLPGWRKQAFQTMLYQLSHATWPEFNDGLGDPDEDQDGGVVASDPSLYPAPKHNSQFGRSCGRIGTFLGLAGLAPPPPEPEDVCPVCELVVAPSERFEVYRLADAPPPAPHGELDWSQWSDTPAQATPKLPVVVGPDACPGCGARAPLRNCRACGGWHCHGCRSGSSSCEWNW
jgi:hypothetical protein